MKSVFSLLALALFSAVLAPGQIVTPTPTPTEVGEVVKISTNLIQIDVTVTDKKGNIVRDLRSDEIEIFENGSKQKISNFSFVSSVQERPEIQPGEPKPVVNTPPTPVRPENVHRTIALVVDDLTLSFESTYYVRRALKKFVDEQMQDGDLVAIIRTGAGIGALQQFTTDKRQLYAAIEKVRWNSIGSGGVGAFAPLEAKIETGEPEDEPEPGERTPEGMEREFNEFRESVFATGTLGAINYIVRGMQDLPGRKSVMLLSDGFKLFSTDALGFKESGRVMDSLRRLVDQANRASVVIYTMDARGLQVTGLTAADDTSGRSAEELAQAVTDRGDQLFDTQAGLQYLAKQTGGFAIINNNDLSWGIRKILDDQSYYVVGYEPEDETFDPKLRRFNRLEVKVIRPGTRVRHRSGFFGVSDEKLVRPKMTGEQKLVNALTSPFSANDISVRLNALFGSEAKTGSYIRSLLHIAAQDLTFTDEPDGSKKGAFDIIAVGFGDNGLPIDQLAKSYTVTLRPDMYERFMRKGFVYDLSFPIKKPGAYQLRIAIRDTRSNKVGSANQFVEVPNLKKNRLTLSGVALENLTFEAWEKREASSVPVARGSDPLSDTSLRRFQRGTVLNYGFVIFNARSRGGRPPDLTAKVRLFLDGKLHFEGKPQAVPFSGQTDPKAVNLTAALSLGSVMPVGDYVMEIVITDNQAKEKQKTATQFVQFEIVR
jgi:VWFA-related protein